MAAATWLAARPAGEVEPRHGSPFAMERSDGVTVSAAVPLVLPYDFADCDVLATVELPAAGEMDLVFRRVEPEAAHGRFHVLRLSATTDGPAFRSRDEVLFADGPPGGLRASAGIPVSVHLELRGRTASAVVGGRRCAPATTIDDHGSLAFVVRGGDALVRYLRVEPRGEATGWPTGWPWLLAAGALAGLLVARRQPHAVRRVAALILAPVGAGVARGLLAPTLLPGVAAGDAGVILLAATFLPLAVALALPGGWRRTAARAAGAVLLALLAGEAFCRLEVAHLRVAEDERLDAYFGAASRQAPFGALARQLHGKNEVHSPHPDVQRIVFLGGEPLFEANLDRRHHLAVQATARAAQALSRPLHAAVVATAFPQTQQQIALYERFYAAAYRPVAVVLGVDRWDSLAEGPRSARARLQGPSPDVPWSWLWRALGPAPRAVATASDAELAAALTEFAHACRRSGTPLLLATHARVPAATLAVVERVAQQEGVALVRSVMSEADEADADALARALVDLLAR